MGIQVEYTVTIGTLVEIVSLVGGGFIFIGVMKRALRDMEKELETMQGEIKEFARAIVQLAVQSNRLDHIEEDVRELRHGRGYIMDTPKLPK